VLARSSPCHERRPFTLEILEWAVNDWVAAKLLEQGANRDDKELYLDVRADFVVGSDMSL